jgi:hypothetical protein
MKMERRLKILVGVLVGVVAATAFLAAYDLLPALRKARQAREDQREMENQINRALLEVRLNSTRLEAGGRRDIPELPEIARSIASLRRAGEEAAVEDLEFDAVHTEKLEVGAGAAGGAGEFVVSRIHVDFSAGLMEAAELLEAIQTEPPDEAFDYLRLSSRSANEDRVDVAMVFRLYGVPR